MPFASRPTPGLPLTRGGSNVQSAAAALGADAASAANASTNAPSQRMSANIHPPELAGQRSLAAYASPAVSLSGWPSSAASARSTDAEMHVNVGVSRLV